MTRATPPRFGDRYARYELTPKPPNWVRGTWKPSPLAAACELAGLTVAQASGPSKSRETSYRRMYVYHLLYLRGWSTTQIGAVLNRDHTTVVYGLRRFQMIREAVCACI